MEKLAKIGRNTYKLQPHMPQKKCNIRVNFQQVCFDNNEERLFTVDSKGQAYLLYLYPNECTSMKLGKIGQSTFVAFNPNEKFEVIVGFVSSEVKLLRIKNDSLVELTHLKGHELPPTWVSFYKSNCLTASRREAIVWNLDNCMKIHQLQLEQQNESGLRKAAFSSLGHIVALYKNDTIQAWRFDQFDSDNRVVLTKYALKNVKDFVFNENGRALIVAGAGGKIVVLDTNSWKASASLNMLEKSGAKRLATVPMPTDIGNKIIAILYDDGNVKFLDCNAKSFVKLLNQPMQGIRKLVVSSQGQWLAFISHDGSLIVTSVQRATNVKDTKVQIKQPRPQAHHVNEHLQYIRRCTKEVLRLSKLLPILQQFGEYPARHRTLIWRTIMKLPDNRVAYANLNDKVPLSSTTALTIKSYKLADKSRELLLNSTIDRLIQLNPLLSQCNYLPEFVFPFIVVFQKNSRAAFEAILTILMNYCQQWFEYHPFPPLNVLGIIENILMEFDSSLVKFYYDHGITSTQYAWPLLNTTMSRILSANEWLILWDHLLSYQNPLLLLMCVVAYNTLSREAIFSLTREKDKLEKFFYAPGAVGVRQIIRVAQRIEREVSTKNHPSRYLRDTFRTLSPHGSYPPILFDEYPQYLVEKPSDTVRDELDYDEIFIAEQRNAAQLAHEKRLVEETENFIKNIQHQRLREFQRCYDEQYRGNLQLRKSTDTAGKSCFAGKKSISCEKLRKDVLELDDDIETFIETIKSGR